MYREIKRRIIAEQAAKITDPVVEIHRDIEMLTIRNTVPNNLVHNKIEFVKMDMVNKLARELFAEGFVEFFISENEYALIADVKEIKAGICVVKPRQKGQ